MRRILATVVLLCGVALAATTAVAPEFFRYSRGLKVPAEAKQAYFVVDRTMWEHMRADLGDMRLYDRSTELPYVLSIQRGGANTQQTPAKLYDLGESAAKTSFKLEAPVAEYDTIALDLKSKNFVTQATVEAGDKGSDWSNLATATIFDFTDEKLGRNFEIRLRAPARFKYLRITIADRIAAKDVSGASMAFEQVRQPSWLALPEQPTNTQSGSETIFEWDASDKVPLDRVEIDVADPGLNFSRSASLEDAEHRVVAAGELKRIHLKRLGREIDREELGLTLPVDSRSKHYRLKIQNGDDRPLPITGVRALSYERRVYFDPQGQSELTLYFGDEKTSTPSYDYARFFEADASAVRADLGPSSANAVYKGRPDDRPWSERNKWLLWVVLIVAVLGLGALAMRTMSKVAK